MEKGNAATVGNLEAVDAAGLMRALGGAHPEAYLSIRIYLGKSDVLVGRAKLAGIGFDGPDGLGLHGCELSLEMGYDDLLTSDALAELPGWALEKVARTGKAIELWELREGPEKLS